MKFLILILSLYVLSVDAIRAPPTVPYQPPMTAFTCVMCRGSPDCADSAGMSICNLDGQCKTVIINQVGAAPTMVKDCNSDNTYPLGCSTKSTGGGMNTTTYVCDTDMCNRKGFAMPACDDVKPLTTTIPTPNGIAAPAGSGNAIPAQIENGGEIVNPTFIISMIAIFVFVKIA